jgi:hypothetical protein
MTTFKILSISKDNTVNRVWKVLSLQFDGTDPFYIRDTKVVVQLDTGEIMTFFVHSGSVTYSDYLMKEIKEEIKSRLEYKKILQEKALIPKPSELINTTQEL